MLLTITILGFIVTFLLLINIRETNKANIYLFALLLINNIYSLAHYATIYSGNKTLIAIMLVHFSPLFMLTGPALFFYIRGIIKDDDTFSVKDLIHFIPALFILINLTGYIFSGWENKLAYASAILSDPIRILNVQTLFIKSEIAFLLRPLFGIGYTIFCIAMLMNHLKLDKAKDPQTLLVVKWMKLLLTVILFIYVSFLLFTIIGFQTRDYETTNTSGYYYLIASSIGLIALNASLLFFPNILYGLPQLDYVVLKSGNKKLETLAPVTEFNVEEDPIKKQSKAFEISDDKLVLLKFKVDSYCEKKPYLNTEFNLTMMSADTDIPVHHLSYFFNEYLKINFNTWKNNLKIDHIIELLHSGSNEMLTLDALAKQAGFGSRTTFFNAFKQKMGVTPSEYLSTLE